MDLFSQDWSNKLTACFTTTIRESAKRAHGRPVSMFAVDFHPWHGAIYLALLLEEEIDGDPELHTPEEMAAWELYDCSNGIPAWNQALDFTKQLRALDPNENDYLRAYRFISSIISALETEIRSTYMIGRGFRISVAHPDTLEEFFKA